MMIIGNLSLRFGGPVQQRANCSLWVVLPGLSAPKCSIRFYTWLTNDSSSLCVPVSMLGSNGIVPQAQPWTCNGSYFESI
jgi:hypothetical protein